MAQFYSRANDPDVLDLFTHRFGSSSLDLTIIDGEICIRMSASPSGGGWGVPDGSVF